MKTVDTIVIGAGIVGLSALDYIAEQGTDVVCLEKNIPGCGQSSGFTRIYRQRHQTHSQIALAQEALNLWRQWEEEFKTELIIKCGQLTFGSDIEQQAEFCKKNKIRCSLLNKDDWKKLTNSHSAIKGQALFEVSAGAIRANVIIRFLKEKHRPRIIHDTVLSIEERGSSIIIKTSDNIYKCVRLIVAAGTETPDLAKQVGIDIKIEKRLHTRLTFQAYQSLAVQPCFSDTSGQYGEHVYGSPINQSLYTIGLSNKQDNLLQFDHMLWEKNKQRIRDYVAVAIPALNPGELHTVKCTATYIEGPADSYQIYENGSIKAIAGHNLFKFGPVLGKLLA